MDLLRLPAAPGEELRTLLWREPQRDTGLVKGGAHLPGQHVQQRGRSQINDPVLKGHWRGEIELSRRAKRALVVAEGLLVYLTEEEVASLGKDATASQYRQPGY